jgi:hypothetical protein
VALTLLQQHPRVQHPRACAAAVGVHAVVMSARRTAAHRPAGPPPSPPPRRGGAAGRAGRAAARRVGEALAIIRTTLATCRLGESPSSHLQSASAAAADSHHH